MVGRIHRFIALQRNEPQRTCEGKSDGKFAMTQARRKVVVLRTLGIVLAGAILWGCGAHGPLFAPKTAPVGKAIVYVYRTDERPDAPGLGKEDIWINDSKLGPLLLGGYLAQELDPGPIHVEEGKPPAGWKLALGVLASPLGAALTAVDAHHWDGHDVSFTAEAGQSYFIKHSWKTGIATHIPQLTLVQPEVGAAEIRACRYSQ